MFVGVGNAFIESSLESQEVPSQLVLLFSQIKEHSAPFDNCFFFLITFLCQLYTDVVMRIWLPIVVA